MVVARPLKITSGSLPTTPFEVGDTFAPQVQISPSVPAHVEVRCELLVDSDPGQAVEFTAQGRANAFGFFDPGAGFAPMTFDAPGEYRVEVAATWEDTNGVFWAGSATWGGVVAPTEAVLVARGRHGLDVPDYDEMTWFFHAQLGVPLVAAHTFYPFHGGDIFWGATARSFPDTGGDAILPVVTFQDPQGAIEQILVQRWETYTHTGLAPFDSLADRVGKSELPLVTTTSDGTDARWSPDLIDQWGYGYRTSQRPGARVHESIAEVETGIAYWRYDATFGAQVGVEGDLAHDLKWQFGSVVFRFPARGIAEYAVFGTLWVLIPDDDPLGPRVTPPFQGQTGGPDGGPILTLKGEDIDLLFLPRGAFPGQLLEVGERLSLWGHVGPPLPSLVTATITSPSNVAHTVSARANRVGYVHAPEQGFAVDEPGVWTVDLQVEHDGLTSAGVTQPPYPTGGVLGASAGIYDLYVSSPYSGRLRVVRPAPGFLPIDGDTVEPIEIVVSAPFGAGAGTLHYTITMPGAILDHGSVPASGSTATVVYDPQALAADFPNLDLKAHDAPRTGLADDVRVTMLWVSDWGRCTGGVVDLRGEEVMHVELPNRPPPPAVQPAGEARAGGKRYTPAPAAGTTEAIAPHPPEPGF